MTITVIGQLATTAGLVQQRDLAGDADPWTMPAPSYLRQQPAVVPVLMDHDWGWPVGTVGHLERAEATGLLMVARLGNDDLGDLFADGDWFLSGGVRCAPTGVMEYGQVRFREISLVRRTANLGTKPIRWSRSDIATDSGSEPHDMPLRWHDTWRRAHDRMVTERYREKPAHLTIHDLDQLSVVDEVLTDPAAARRRAGHRPEPPPPSPAPSVRPVGLVGPRGMHRATQELRASRTGAGRARTALGADGPQAAI